MATEAGATLVAGASQLLMGRAASLMGDFERSIGHQRVSENLFRFHRRHLGSGVLSVRSGQRRPRIGAARRGQGAVGGVDGDRPHHRRPRRARPVAAHLGVYRPGPRGRGGRRSAALRRVGGHQEQARLGRSARRRDRRPVPGTGRPSSPGACPARRAVGDGRGERRPQCSGSGPRRIGLARRALRGLGQGGPTCHPGARPPRRPSGPPGSLQRSAGGGTHPPGLGRGHRGRQAGSRGKCRTCRRRSSCESYRANSPQRSADSRTGSFLPHRSGSPLPDSASKL